MAEPMKVTSRGNAVALSVYLAQVCLGWLYLLGIAEAQTMTDLTNPVIADLWALLLLASGMTCAVAALWPTSNPLPPMRVEAWAALALALVSGVYQFTLVVGFGWMGVATTQTYALMVACGCAVRAVQIAYERRDVRRKLAKRPPTTEVLADPEGD